MYDTDSLERLSCTGYNEKDVTPEPPISGQARGSNTVIPVTVTSHYFRYYEGRHPFRHALPIPLREKEASPGVDKSTRGGRMSNMGIRNAVPMLILILTLGLRAQMPSEGRFIAASKGKMLVFDLKAPDSVAYTLGTGYGPAVSPDGKTVLFKIAPWDSLYNEIWAVNIDGSNRRMLFDGLAQVHSLSYAEHDGEALVLHTATQKGSSFPAGIDWLKIPLLSGDTPYRSNAYNVADTLSYFTDADAALNQILYVMNDVASIDGIVVTTQVPPISEALFSPDGNEIILYSDAESQGYLMSRTETGWAMSGSLLPQEPLKDLAWSNHPDWLAGTGKKSHEIFSWNIRTMEMHRLTGIGDSLITGCLLFNVFDGTSSATAIRVFVDAPNTKGPVYVNLVESSGKNISSTETVPGNTVLIPFPEMHPTALYLQVKDLGGVYPVQYWSGGSDNTTFPYKELRPPLGDTIDFPVSLTTTPVDTVPTEPAKIHGLLLDPMGQPASDYTVEVRSVEDTSIVVTSVTGTGGLFALSRVPALISVVLRVHANSYNDMPAQYWYPGGTCADYAHAFTLAERSVFDVRIALSYTPPTQPPESYIEDVGAVSGRVIGSIDGVALEGVRVVIKPPAAQDSIITHTDSRGRFLFYDIAAYSDAFVGFSTGDSGVYPPQYWSWGNTTVEPASYLQANPYVTRYLGDIHLSETPPSGSTDTVHTATPDTGYGNAFLRLLLHDEKGNSLHPTGVVELHPRDSGQFLQSPPEGSVVNFYGVPPDSYHIYLRLDGYPYQYYAPTRNTTNPSHAIKIGEKDTTMVGFSLTHNPVNLKNLHGYALSETGNPLQGVTVTSYSYTNPPSPLNAVITDSYGYYNLGFVENVKYYVSFEYVTEYPFQWQGYPGNTMYSQYGIFPSEARDTSRVYLNSAPVDNEPVSQLTINVYDKSGKQIAYKSVVRLLDSHTMQPSAELILENATLFQFHDIHPGAYAVQLESPDSPRQFHAPEGNTSNPYHFVHVGYHDTLTITTELSPTPIYQDPYQPPDSTSHAREKMTVYQLRATDESAFDAADGKLSDFWNAWWNYSDSTKAYDTYEPDDAGMSPPGYAYSADTSETLIYPSDASVSIRGAYGEIGLYLLFEVVDDYFVETASVSSPYVHDVNDVIDFFLDPTPLMDIQAAEEEHFYLFPDYQLTRNHAEYSARFRDSMITRSTYNAAATNEFFQSWKTVTREAASVNFGLKVEEIVSDDGLVRFQEWLIPWNMIGTGMAQAVEGQRIAATFDYRDVDPVLSDGYTGLAWINGATPYSRDSKFGVARDAWGELIFGPALFSSTDTTWNSDSTWGATLSGSVHDYSGMPVGEARVVLVPTNNMKFEHCFEPEHVYGRYEAITGSDGAYSISGIERGEYMLMATASHRNLLASFFPGATSHETAEKIVLNDTTRITNARIDMTPGAGITGYVVSSSDGRGVPGISVEIWREDGCGWSETVTGPAGRFVLQGLTAGTYGFEIRDERGQWFPTDDVYKYNDTSFALNTGSLMAIDKISVVRGGRLYGNFSAADPARLSPDSIFARAICLTANPSRWEDRLWPEHVTPLMKTSATAYKTGGIPPGDWRILLIPAIPMSMDTAIHQDFARGYSHGLGWAYAGGAATFDQASVFSITSGSLVSAPATKLPEGYTLYGTVLDENNHPLGHDSTPDKYHWYEIMAYVKDSSWYVPVSHSEDIFDSRFGLPGISAGREIYIRVHADGYPDQWWGPTEGNSYEPREAFVFSSEGAAPLKIRLTQSPAGTPPEEDENRLPAITGLSTEPVGIHTIAVRWNALDPVYPLSHYRVYRLSGTDSTDWAADPDGFWYPLDEDFANSRIDSFKVSKTYYFDNSVKPGLKYLYAVAGIDTAGNEGDIHLSTDNSISSYMTSVSFQSFPTATVLKPGMWHMTGTGRTDTIQVGGNMTVYEWDDHKEPSKLLDGYRPVSRFAPLRGYWAFPDSAMVLRRSALNFAELYKNRNDVRVSIQKGRTGWCQISSPFPYEVAPSWLAEGFTAFEWISEGNRYVQAGSLKPWKAYWVYNPGISDTVLSLPSVPSVATGSALAKKTDVIDWELSISLVGKNESDPDNYLGVVKSGLSKKYHYESPEPPPAFSFSQLYFVTEGRRLSKRYLPSGRNDFEWHVAVSSSDEPMKIRMKGLTGIPKDMHLFWIDKEGAQRIGDTTTIPVPPHSDTKHGYILATRNPNIVALYTGKFHLAPSYPNPFIHTTTIEFVIPYAWNADGTKQTGNRRSVKLYVYDMSGRRVATLLDGTTEVGVYRKVWNGRNDNGRLLAGGMYIAHLRTGEFAKSIKMFRLR